MLTGVHGHLSDIGQPLHQMTSCLRARHFSPCLFQFTCARIFFYYLINEKKNGCGMLQVMLSKLENHSQSKLKTLYSRTTGDNEVRTQHS